MHKLTILIITLLLSCAAIAQPYGNADRARERATKTDADLSDPVVRLGYINNDKATLLDFMDNLEVGLQASGFPDSRIISYSITLLPKGQDIRSSDVIKGSKIPRAVFNELHMDALKRGDVVIFENIKLEESRRAFRVMNNLQIKIQ